MDVKIYTCARDGGGAATFATLDEAIKWGRKSLTFIICDENDLVVYQEYPQVTWNGSN
jgi:hypothetical protein